MPVALSGLTWELDGANWTERQDIGPAARWGHAMSFDADRARIVMFGGNRAAPDAAEELLGDGSCERKPPGKVVSRELADSLPSAAADPEAVNLAPVQF